MFESIESFSRVSNYVFSCSFDELSISYFYCDKLFFNCSAMYCAKGSLVFPYFPCKSIRVAGSNNVLAWRRTTLC